MFSRRRLNYKSLQRLITLVFNCVGGRRLEHNVRTILGRPLIFCSRSLIFSSSSLVFCISLMWSSLSVADSRDQAKRLHDRLAGVPPTETVLQDMANLIDAGSAVDAAYTAMDNPSFYGVTLKNWATPWTNEENDIFAPFNDFTATVIGLIRDSTQDNNPIDYRVLLYGNVLYVGADNLGLPAYSNNNNDHYAAMESQGVDLKTGLTPVAQSDYNGLPADATAGIMTTRAAAKSYFIAGTNRSMFAHVLLNHLCKELEQIKDNTRATDRIRQDVARSPGGDSRIFNNNCMGCHSGMDPLAQAFAYYDYIPVKDAEGENTENGTIDYNQAGAIDPDSGTRIQGKYLINSNNFPTGYITPDDHWDNYWRDGPNKLIGWSNSISGVATPGAGNGAKTLGMELAHSDAFAQCQVEKAFKAVCFRNPGNSADRNKVTDIIGSFQNSNYNMKQVFAETAVYCMGD